MTFGSCLMAAKVAFVYDSVSEPTSRWLITDFLFSKTYSTGSSMVMIWQRRLLLMYWIIEATVVDLPLPVAPTTRISPRRNEEIFSRTGGRPSSSKDLITTGMTRKTIL